MTMSVNTGWIAAAFGLAVLAAAVTWLSPRAQAAQPPVYTGIVKGVAVGGYDPVAYFTGGKAVPGKKDITLDHEGATWRFASEANREAFKAEPEKFAPQYGGYCAYAAAMGYTAKGDPNAWSLVNGKLYLNFNLETKAVWEKDIAGYIAKADANWPAVLQK